MYGVEHLRYWGVTEDFADSKWCCAFNNFLWIHALKFMRFDLPSEQSLLGAPDLCSAYSSCSQSVMFWMMLALLQQTQKAGPPSGCQATQETFPQSCPLVPWVGRLSTHPCWLSHTLVSTEWNSYGILKSWLSYYPPSFVEITLTLRAVKLVVSEPLNCICNSSWSRCFSVWMHTNHSDLEDEMKCLQQHLYRLD